MSACTTLPWGLRGDAHARWAPHSPPARCPPARRGQATTAADAAAKAGAKPHPFALVEPELQCIAERMRRVLLTEVPQLHAAATHFVADPSALGKLMRPSVVMLMSSALSAEGGPAPAHLAVDLSPPSAPVSDPRRRQQRIAEITEMIHVATLMHDDVLDEAATRRGKPSVNAALGNKVAILGGDFLLARASISLASLGDPDVMSMLATVLEHLVAGEVMQADAREGDLVDLGYYSRKTFLKTASLVAHACKAAAKVGGHGEATRDLAYRYGEQLGLAFQIVDDVLDFTQSSGTLGKPALNDLRSGLATAPVLLALPRHPELAAMARRRFRGPGDVEAAEAAVRGSGGIEAAREMAARHARAAAECVRGLPPPASAGAEEARAALVEATETVLTRVS